MDDLMDNTGYGRAALSKFGSVPEGFHIFFGAWSKDRETMRVKGAQFKGNRKIPRTTMETIVTAEEVRTHKDPAAVP